MSYYIVNKNEKTYELYHYGILGMKWGIRRYQDKNGKLTAEGVKRYRKQINNGERYAETGELTEYGEAVKKSLSSLKAVTVLGGPALWATYPALKKSAQVGLGAYGAYGSKRDAAIAENKRYLASKESKKPRTKLPVNASSTAKVKHSAYDYSTGYVITPKRR